MHNLRTLHHVNYSLSHRAVWAGAAHREADGREYHPVSRLTGMRVCGHMGEQAFE